MKGKLSNSLKGISKNTIFLFFFGFAAIFFILMTIFPAAFGGKVTYDKNTQSANTVSGMESGVKEEKVVPVPIPPLDKALYDKKLLQLANNPPAPPAPQPVQKFDPVTGKPILAAPSESAPLPQPLQKPTLWPVKAPYPNAGAILPFKRIIAYYGNLYSTKMGVLGQYTEEEMLARLDTEVKKWDAADPSTPTIPALHYIAVVAQGSPGLDGKYRLRMPFSEIDKVLAMAAKKNALVFLDFQVGFSTIQEELPIYEKYFKLPNVHLGIDPEFSMKNGIRPGKVVGTLDASDINFASDFLAKIVRENNLTPKVVIVHRYTQKMVTNYKMIKILPEVQMLMNMDGWGVKAKKINTFQQFIYREPVMFTGFKLFYKNDILEKGTAIMTPEDILKLQPKPIYIQYQ